jgi:hypothetical protein
MKAMVDNDIIFKGTCYGLLDEFLSPVCATRDLVGVLGAAQFVVSKKITKKNPKKGIAVALRHLKDFLERVTVVEPTEDEQKMAAEFELAAQRAGLVLDVGESQLCAIVICRLTPLLLTGDKRAIQAIEELLDCEGPAYLPLWKDQVPGTVGARCPHGQHRSRRVARYNLCRNGDRQESHDLFQLPLQGWIWSGLRRRPAELHHRPAAASDASSRKLTVPNVNRVGCD